MKNIERKDVHIEEQKKNIAALKESVVAREQSIIELNEKVTKSIQEVEEAQEESKSQMEVITQFQESLDQRDVVGKDHRDEAILIESTNLQNELLISKLHEDCSCLQQMLDEQATEAQREVKSLRMEKDQMLAIVTEKSRECSQLKSEVHRLMNIVSAEKTALSKLQQDNSELRQKQEAPNNDMTKEAVKKLSALVRDKDMEIEALTQKNTSLLQVLQEGSQHGAVLANLIQERDNLHKQVRLFQSDREQLIQALNAKHSESLMYHSEIQRLTAVISTETEKKDKLQQEYSNLVQQYEDKQKILLNAQNEILNYKQKLVEVDNCYKEVLQQQLQMSQSATNGEGKTEVAESITATIHKEQSDEYLHALIHREQDLQEQVHSLQCQVAHLQEQLQHKVTVESEDTHDNTEEVESDSRDTNVGGVDIHDVSKVQTSSILPCNHQVEIDALQAVLDSHEAAFVEKDNIIATKDQLIKEKDVALAQQNKAFNQKQTDLNNKDKAFGELSMRFHKTEQMLRTRDTEIGNLTKQVEKLTFRLSGMESELKDVYEDRDHLQDRIPMLEQESSMLKEANNKLSMSVNDKDFEINALKEKSNTLGKLLVDKRSVGEEKGEMDRLMKETETLHQQAQAFKQDRDQFILALQQQQGENAELKLQFHNLQEEKQKLVREVSRLREHLLAVEEGYTREALDAEDREKDLRTRLSAAQERALHASTTIHNANAEAAQQMSALQNEVATAYEQRDATLLQLVALQEQASQYAAQLQNLQVVLEQFQHEHEVAKAAEVERCEREVERLRKENVAIAGEMRTLQAQLSESEEAVEAAHRLSNQLDRKEELISVLREEVQSREQQMKILEEDISHLRSATEAKVEKNLMKNLLAGYFHTKQKADALQVIGHVLDMTDTELQEFGAEASGRSWLGGLWARSTSLPPTPKKTALHTTSFSEMFIKYLEKESTPIPQIQLNAERMIQEQNVKKAHTFNPFMAPIPTSQATKVTGTATGGNIMTSTATPLPLFSSHVLRNVLQ